MNKKNIYFMNSFEFKDVSELKTWDMVDIQIMRVGKWNHKYYWPFEVTTSTLRDVVSNFENKVRWLDDIAVDENHEYNHAAMWRYRKLYMPTGDELRATIELTEYGAEKLSKWMYKYFSPEIIRKDIDEETAEEITNLLIGGAFTNRPFFKKMVSLQASEWTTWQGANDTKPFIFYDVSSMEKIKTLLGQYKWSKTLNFNQKYDLKATFNELTDEEKATVQSDVDENLAKPEVEATAPAVVAPASVEPVKPADGEAVSASEFSEMKTKLKEYEYKTKFSENEKVADSMCYSETNKTGVFNTAKQKDSLTAFLMGLTEKQVGEFSELIKGIDASIFGMFSEVWSSSTNASASTSEEQKQHEAIKAFAEKNQCSYAEAINRIDRSNIA